MHEVMIGDANGLEVVGVHDCVLLIIIIVCVPLCSS